MKVSVVFTVYFFLLVIESCTSAPAKKFSTNQYLNKYGYLGFFDGPPPPRALENAITSFQKYAGIAVTGKVDQATIAMITGPRCGAKDKKSLLPNRKKRFTKQGTLWKKKDLTYSIHGYPTEKVSSTIVKRTLQKSFKMWQDVSSLTFRQLSDNNKKADIIINAYSGFHGDPEPFDGEGGTLAHGIYPKDNIGIAGDIHFDDDEIWTSNGEEGTTDFAWASLHEIGHSIGLDHASNGNAIMWPWFQGFKPNEKLYQDDINGIQSIYGVPKQKAKSTICNTRNFDAVMHHRSTKSTYFFKGENVWLMDDAKKIVNHELISKKWQGLEGNLDAAYTRNDGDTIFFKENRFWRYRGFVKIEGPHPLFQYIKNHREAKLDKIDGLMVWHGNMKTYIFSGDQYWRYNEMTKTTDNGYPKHVKTWKYIKYPVDDVMTWKNGKTFFFNKENIYRFRNDGFRMKIKRKQSKQRINYFIKSCRG